MNRIVFAVLAATTVFCAPAHSAESIVGTWDNDDCTRPMVIGQLTMQANDTICRFDSVKRKGDRVTWKGDCNGEKRTVVAELQGNGQLDVSIIDGEVYTGLKRCDGRGGGGEAGNGIPPFLKKNTSYNQARGKLLKGGWDTHGGELRQDGQCDDSIDDRCEAFPEALSCSGSGAALCNMVWIKDGQMITVTTSGEDTTDLTITRVRNGTP